MAFCFKQILFFLAELIIALIHPYFFRSSNKIEVILKSNNGVIENAGFNLHTLLTVLMFSRIYLLARCLVLHHQLTNDSLSHILGKLNEVDMNFGFVFKAILQARPWTMLFCMIAMVYAIASWSMRACESVYGFDSPLTNMFNSFWLVVITYLTVGYDFH